jgi:ADP-ribose pyrophosphatase
MQQPQELFQGRRFRVERVIQTTPDGAEHVREVVRHPGAVTILPILDGGRVCLVQNFRAAVDQMLLELPAGTLEPGENPAVTATRELAEETGYRAGRIRRLATFYMSPGILDERMHLYLATSLKPGTSAPEPGEQVQPVVTTWEKALAMCQDGRIQDAKTLVGLLYYEAFLCRQQLA